MIVQGIDVQRPEQPALRALDLQRAVRHTRAKRNRGVEPGACSKQPGQAAEHETQRQHQCEQQRTGQTPTALAGRWLQRSP